MNAPEVSLQRQTSETEISFEKLNEDEIVELKSCISALIRTEGWKTLRGVVESQVQLKNMSLLQPLASRDAILSCEHLKGQVAGAIGVLDLPQIILDQLTNQQEED